MKLPRILIIDDQYAVEKTTRGNFLFATKMRAVPLEAEEEDLLQQGDEIAIASFCRGQDESGKNDYTIIQKAIETNWSKEKEHTWSLVLLDVMFGDDKGYGEKIRPEILKDFPGLPILMLTGKRQSELARQSGSDYLSKDGLNDYSIRDKLLEFGKLNNDENRYLLQLDNDMYAFSPAMTNVFQLALKVAHSKATALILGETGVGKEVIAKYIHRQSLRKDKPFVAINITTLENLLESELFGSEKGSFTGSIKTKVGLFEKARGGTLFLDEIGDMTLSSQVKILRALQERKIKRIGGVEEIPIEIKLLSATSKDIPLLIRKGKFREDLYHRINTIPIQIPPLRERKEEILPLTESFLHCFMKTYNKKGIQLSKKVIKFLQNCNFPGNIRQLENTVARFVALKGNNQVISFSDLPSDLEQFSGKTPFSPTVVENDKSEYSPETEQITELKKHIAELEKKSSNSLTLSNLAEQLASIKVDPNDFGLKKAIPKLESAFIELKKRIFGASFIRHEKDESGKTDITEAIRYIGILHKGVIRNKISPSQANREIKKLIGKPTKDTKIEDKDINLLIKAWKSGPKK